MAALICDICGGKLKVGSELSNKIDALKREVSILSHKIFGRKKHWKKQQLKSNI